MAGIAAKHDTDVHNGPLQVRPAFLFSFKSMSSINQSSSIQNDIHKFFDMGLKIKK